MQSELRFDALPREHHYLGLRNFRRHRLSAILNQSLFRELPTVASTYSSPMSYGRHRTKRLALSLRRPAHFRVASLRYVHPRSERRSGSPDYAPRRGSERAEVRPGTLVFDGKVAVPDAAQGKLWGVGSASPRLAAIQADWKGVLKSNRSGQSIRHQR